MNLSVSTRTHAACAGHAIAAISAAPISARDILAQIVTNRPPYPGDPSLESTPHGCRAHALATRHGRPSAAQLPGPIQAARGLSRKTCVRAGMPSSAQVKLRSVLPMAKDLHVSIRLR